VKIHVKEGTDEILGCTIVGHHAGDMISEVTTCIQYGLGAGKLAGVIHPLVAD
jgi:pyruvate/2-oxoglutarate dehydrogenase complex dihydrolipoamide dehydrogenase (E3) component